MKKIGLASDHAGYPLKEQVKEWLIAMGYEFVDFGTHSTESCNYPEFAHAFPCRFPGCMHISEPDCGVKPLLASGELTEQRYERYKEIAKDYQLRRRHRYD